MKKQLFLVIPVSSEADVFTRVATAKKSGIDRIILSLKESFSQAAYLDIAPVMRSDYQTMHIGVQFEGVDVKTSESIGYAHCSLISSVLLPDHLVITDKVVRDTDHNDYALLRISANEKSEVIYSKIMARRKSCGASPLGIMGSFSPEQVKRIIKYVDFVMLSCTESSDSTAYPPADVLLEIIGIFEETNKALTSYECELLAQEHLS